MFHYETYEPGKSYGHDRFEMDRERRRLWRDMFPPGGDRMPVALSVLIQQQAFTNVITPRAPGHVQGGQSFEFHSLPADDAPLDTEVYCIDKEIRRGRQWVRIGFTCRDGTGQVVFKSVNSVIVPKQSE